MHPSNSTTEWSRIQKVIHWLMAILIIGAAGLGIYMIEFPPEEWSTGYWLYELHKSIGILLFVLLVSRVVSLSILGRPIPFAQSKPEKTFIYVGHGVIYFLIVAQILIGASRTYADPLGLTVSFFGIFEIPDFIPNDSNSVESLKLAHRFVAILLGVVILGHILMALHHHYIRKDDTLRRMLKL